MSAASALIGTTSVSLGNPSRLARPSTGSCCSPQELNGPFIVLKFNHLCDLGCYIPYYVAPCKRPRQGLESDKQIVNSALCCCEGATENTTTRHCLTLERIVHQCRIRKRTLTFSVQPLFASLSRTRGRAEACSVHSGHNFESSLAKEITTKYAVHDQPAGRVHTAEPGI